MTSERKSYTEEFKREVVRLHLTDWRAILVRMHRMRNGWAKFWVSGRTKAGCTRPLCWIPTLASFRVGP